MGVLDDAPRGALREEVGGVTRLLKLRNREIERFEDRNRGVFDLWDGFMGHSQKPTLGECRDLLSLGLVGGGLEDHLASEVVSALGPDQARLIYKLAQALVGVAFYPDWASDDEPASEETGKKDTAPHPGM